MKNAGKIHLIMQIIQKNAKKNTVSGPGKTPLKFKMATKSKQFPSRTCCKHRRTLSYYHRPVIEVLQQCTDGMATV